MQRLALLLFFFSGFSGLVYEVLWTRRLGLVFGHSALAVSTVVAAYMGGLALGSQLGGRWSERRPVEGFLKAYGRLELFIGIWGGLSLLLLQAVESAYFGLAVRGAGGRPLELVAFVLSLGVLLPPTTAMGATLPLLTAYLSSEQKLGYNLSRLYASNTWGAVLGAGVAGFVLLPWLGLQGSILLAALVNLGVGVLAIRAPALQQESSSLVEPSASSPRSRQALPVVFAVSGFASMLLQLAWTRGISVLLGSSVYAFASILVAFLAGIALGSGLFAWLWQSRPSTRAQLAWLYAGVATGSLLTLPLLAHLPSLFLRLFPLCGGRFEAQLALTVGLCCLVLLGPTLLMGLIFPLVTQLYHRPEGRGLGSSVAAIYSANTLGCILGSFLGGFFVLPWGGVEQTLQAACLCYLLCAVVMSPRCWPAFPLLAALWMVIPPWDTGLAAAGLAISAARQGQPQSSSFPPPVYYKDGLSCSVALSIDGPGALNLKVNGKADASLQVSDRLTQTSLGLIPLLYQKEPNRVAVVGLGSGLTLTALADHQGVKHLECAELEPAVMECQRYWAPFNSQVTSNSKVKVALADGRTFLLARAPGQLDVIVSEPSNPWIAGIGNLYTLDFYRACARQLRPGGCFVQWCNLYAVSPPDVDLVLRTFYEAFPEGELWTTGGDLILVGSQQPMQASLQNWQRHSPWLDEELRQLGFASRQEFVGQYLCSRKEALAQVGSGPYNRDDLPILEYSAPRSLYRPQALAENLARLLQWRSLDWPAGWKERDEVARYLGRLQVQGSPPPAKGLLPSPWQEFLELLSTPQIWKQTWPERANWELGRRLLGAGRPQLALKWLPPSAARQRAQAFLDLGQWQKAAEELAKLPTDSLTLSSLASCSYFQGQAEQAQTLAQRALELNPYDPRALYILAAQGRDLQIAQKLTAVCPVMPNAWILLAELQLQQGQSKLAQQSVQAGWNWAGQHPRLEQLGQQLGLKFR